MPAQASAPATRRAGVKVELPFKAEKNKRELLIASPQMEAKTNESADVSPITDHVATRHLSLGKREEEVGP